MALHGLLGLFICRVRGKSQTHLHFRFIMPECHSHISSDYTAPYGFWWFVKKNQKTPDDDKDSKSNLLLIYAGVSEDDICLGSHVLL